MMKHLIRMTVACLALSSAVAFAQTPAPQQRLRGTVSKIDGQTVSLALADGGNADVRLAGDYTVSGVAKIAASDIKPGSYIGAGARPQTDGTLRAVQIIVFPEAMRGTGEGHRDWLLPQSTMTNATVESTVGSVDGPSMKLSYKGGDKQLTIPTNATILSIVDATRDDMKVGAKVLIAATKGADGSLQSSRVTIAKDGAPIPL